ncbi:MAG: HD domain-containing protein [Bacteriovoracaceae bacterium]|nr:HD domain-containing protein [Bacteriovoracaceae bacterium]
MDELPDLPNDNTATREQSVSYKIVLLVNHFLLNHFEKIFIISILLLIIAINYLVDPKITFLNLFFLPVIIAGQYLGTRFSVTGAFMCVSLVTLYCTLYPTHFVTTYDLSSVYLYISAWGGFLIMAGAVVGKQRDSLQNKIDQTYKLNKDLANSEQALQSANQNLKAHSEGLEQQISVRTKELQTSYESIQELKNKVETTLYSTMDPVVAQQIISGRLRNEKREISVMFTDLANFTNYSEELSPELVVRDLNRYMNFMDPQISKYKGHIDKHIGDGIMCEFGAPVVYEQYKLLAVIAAIKMHEEMKRQSFPWSMRIGIASGPAIVGMIGAKRQSYTAIGDVVNVASRLESLSLPGKILIDKDTYDGVSRIIDAIPFTKIDDETVENQLNTEKEIALYKSKLQSSVDKQDKCLLIYQLGYLYMSLKEYKTAATYFKDALTLSPNTIEYKLAYAEATLNDQSNEELNVKGRSKSVQAYKVIGIKDPLTDRAKLPIQLVSEFEEAKSYLNFCEDDILPVEVLDCSVGHSKIVAFLAYLIAKDLGLSKSERTSVINAAFMADVGKEVIPQYVLNRMGPLSNREFDEVKKHPIESTRVVKRMGHTDENLLSYISHSHENIDGSGYPDGLKGEDIPLGSKILSVVDCYAALISWRPYREPWNLNVALDELLKGVEKHKYDKNVVSSLCKIINIR